MAVTDNGGVRAHKLARSLAAAVALAIAAWVPAAASAATPVVTEFGGLNAGYVPGDITAGPDGNLWFVQVDDNNLPATADLVSRITPAGVLTESPLPSNNNTGPLGIAAGPDGNVWFTEEVGQFVSRVAPGTPPLLVTPFPGDAGMSANTAPAGIVAGPDGNLWYTDRRTDGGNDVIGRFTLPPPTLSGEVHEYSVGAAASNPSDIAVGSDGALWFTEPGINSIGRITTGGTVNHFGPAGITAGPTRIAAGPDGNLWFTEVNGNTIGRITTAGVVTEYHLSASPAARSPYGIAAGPDGNMWFTERTGVGPGAIARINPGTGAVTEYPSGGADAIPGLTAGAEPLEITAGPDGNMWFTERSFNKIGRITIPGGGDADGDGIPDASDQCPNQAGVAGNNGCPAGGGGGSADTADPDTTITKKPKKKSKKKKVAVLFASSEAGSTFTCQVNTKPPVPCSSGFKAKSKKGKNKVLITATDAAGNVDDTPAVASWKFASG